MKASPEVLLRYCDLVTNPSRFLRVSQTPLPVTGWHHPGRTLVDHPCDNELPWLHNGFKGADTARADFLIGFLTGSLLIQEEAAMLAAHLLNIGPGARVLDLCAAPGNKTAQISTILRDTGLVVANDPSRIRLGVLRGTLDRLGLSNVITTNYDARRFPIPERLFDAVLADVPCSCEGTSRKHPEAVAKDSEAERNRLCRIQEKILRRALECTRPGGRVVYATCTYAPEENERVVHRVVSDPPEGCSIEIKTIDIPGFNLARGLTSWRGEQFDGSLARTARIWPHENDTGGFYLAVLERMGGPGPGMNSGAERMHSAIHVEDWPWAAHAFLTRHLEAFRQIHTSSKYDRFVSGDLSLPPEINPASVGMTGLNTKSTYPRFSTALALKVGSLARAGIAHIDPDRILDYYARSANLPARLIPPCERSRMVIVRSNDLILGLGSVPEGSTESVNSLFPKVWGGLQVAKRVEQARR